MFMTLIRSSGSRMPPKADIFVRIVVLPTGWFSGSDGDHESKYLFSGGSPFPDSEPRLEPPLEPRLGS